MLDLSSPSSTSRPESWRCLLRTFRAFRIFAFSPSRIVRQVIWFIFIPLISSLLLTASFSPYDFGFLAWFSLAPLFFGLRQTTVRGAMLLSSVFGVLFTFLAFAWFRELEEVSVSGYSLAVCILTLYFLLFGFLYHRMSQYRASWLLLACPAFWVVLEYVRSNLFFLSLPWNLIGHTQYRYLPIIQITSLVGVYGLSFLIVLVNQVVSQLPEWIMGWRESMASHSKESMAWCIGPFVQVGIACVFLGLAVGYGWFVLGSAVTDRTIRVGIVQGNVLNRAGMSSEEQAAHLKAYQQLTREASELQPDLIVWPASALPGRLSSNRLVRFMMRRIAVDSGAHIVAGGAGGDKIRPKKDGYLNYSNSEFLISPTGKVVNQYHKMQLMPFNEYLPLQSYVTWPTWLTSLQESFEPGTERILFEVAGASFGVPICWENVFPDHFRQFVKAGAQFMVTSTNEGFFGKSQAPYQSLAINVFRAVENRRAIIRTSTTGISGFISPAGEILDVIRDADGHELFVSGFLVRDIPLNTVHTIYTSYGDVFAYGLIGLLALWVIVGSVLYQVRKSIGATYV